MAAPDRDTLESLLKWAAAELLGRAAEHGFTVRAQTDENGVDYAVKPGQSQAAAEACRALVAGTPIPNGIPADLVLKHFFSDDEAEIVRAIGNDHISSETIAKRLKTEPGTQFRNLLAGLRRRGILIATSSGYRVSDPRLLPLAGRATGAPGRRRKIVASVPQPLGRRMRPVPVGGTDHD